MRKFTKYIAFLIVLTPLLFAQSGWFQQNSGTNKQITSCFFLNDNTGYASGKSGVILKTTNSGNNWSNVYNQIIYDVLTVSFLNTSTGWAFIRGTNALDSAFIIKTTNAGGSWSRSFIDTGAYASNLAEIKFFDINTGYLANAHGVIKTTNGGLSWVLQNSNVLLPSCLSFLSESTGWAGGYQTSLYKTTDSGQNWTQQFKNQSNTFSRRIIFLNSSTGFYATDYSIYRSTDGGDNWNENFYQSNIYPVSMFFLNVNTGWGLSLITDTTFRNVVVKTTNSGANWSVYELNLQYRRFHNIFFSSQSTGWITGDSGFIYKTTNGGVPIGIQPISTEIPNGFSLSQNYPNPFNPTTIINFQIPKSNYVTLDVYDLLGRKVSSLVNEDLKAGTYEIDFSGAGFASGIYYYSLRAGEYQSVKKMVLVK